MNPNERSAPNEGDSHATPAKKLSKTTQEPADRSGGSGQKQIGGERQGDDNPRDTGDRDSTQH
jgi:hypothetical protein